jgi:hypothetical protein
MGDDDGKYGWVTTLVKIVPVNNRYTQGGNATSPPRLKKTTPDITAALSPAEIPPPERNNCNWQPDSGVSYPTHHLAL